LVSTTFTTEDSTSVDGRGAGTPTRGPFVVAVTLDKELGASPQPAQRHIISDIAATIVPFVWRKNPIATLQNFNAESGK